MQQAGTPSRSSQGWRSIAVDDPEIAAWYEQLRADHPDEPKGIVDHMDASIRAYGDGSGRGYDYKTAIEGGLRPSMQPDGKYHWGGEAGEVIVKGKQHPTRHLTDQAKSQAVQDKGFDDLLLALDGDPAPSGRVEDASDEMDDLLEVLDADLLQWADVSPTRVGRYFQGMGESVRSGEGLPSLIGLGIQGYNMGQVVLAAQRVQANEGTEEDEQLLSRFQVEQAKEAVRNQYLSYRSGGMTAQSGAFMADILTTAGAGALGKAALKKGLIEGAESIAEKAITKSLAARAAKSVGKAAADITKLTVGMEALGQVGAHIGGKGILQREEGEGFGGGIITNETWRAAREKFHVLAEVDPNGELYAEILGHTPDFIDVLDEGIVSALIEVGSEQSGEAILYGMKRSLPWLSKLPLADRARVVYGGAMVTLSQKYGIPVPQAASILRRAGFHGPPIEIVEEYIGEAARKTAPNLEGHTWNTEDFWDQSFETSNHLAEIAISSAVIGGVGGVVGLAAGPPEVPLRQRVESKVQRLGEELTEAGLEREAREAEGLMDLTGEAPSLEQIETQIAQLDEDLAEGQRLLEMSDAEMESELRRALGDELPAGSEESTKLVQQLGEGEDVPLHPPMPMTGPGEIDAVVDQGLQRMQEDFPGLRLAEIPEEHSVAAEVIQLQAKEQDAVDVVFVTGDEMFTAMQAGEGVHFVNVNRLGDLAHVVSLRVHESIHDVAARNSDLFDRLRRALAAHDPEGFAGHMDDYQQKWAEVGAAVNLPPGLATEEGIAHYAQTYAGPISYLRTKRGQQWLKEVYEQEPGLFRQIVEFVKDLLARVGLPTTGRQQRELDKLTKHLEGLGRGPGRRLTPAVLDAVEQIAAALDSVLGHGPSRLQSPSQRQGPDQGVGTPETTETPPQAPEAPEAREEAAEAAPDPPRRRSSQRCAQEHLGHES
jgi:hypothetical protein